MISITKWKPENDDQVIVERDGKLFICHFAKVFGTNKQMRKKLSVYERFMIGKESYINQLDVITSYTNFFINIYDTDKELVAAYLKIKYALDKEKIYTKENMDSYIDFLYEVMFTPTIVDRIIQLVEDNYLDDIEVDTDSKKKYLRNGKSHLESLEFTNQHIKILLQISFSMKIMAPAIFHYIQLNNIKIEKDSDIIFRFYKKLFSIYGFGDTYEIKSMNGTVVKSNIPREEFLEFLKKNHLEESQTKAAMYPFVSEDGTMQYYTRTKIDIYTKLFVYVKAKVLESNANNAPIFAQREIFGVDVQTVVHLFTRKVLISENVIKYRFNEHWDAKLKKYKENIVGFNKTIIKFQLSYFLKDQYSKNLTEVTNVRNSEGLSGSDKMLMNANKLDEGVVTMADINIEKTIEKIKKDIDLPLTKDEVDYYMKNLNPAKIQIQLVYGYYTKYFGSYRDLNLLTKRQYITLLLLLKKKLLLDLGYETDEVGEIHYAALPYILTGNLSDKVNTRIIRNNKFINKIENNAMYQDLIDNKYRLLNYLKPDSILQLLSSIINTRFTYVTYEYPELLGTEIIYNEDKISDELLFFLSNI